LLLEAAICAAWSAAAKTAFLRGDRSRSSYFSSAARRRRQLFLRCSRAAKFVARGGAG